MTDELNSLAESRKQAGSLALDHEGVKYYTWIIRGLVVFGFACGLFFARLEYNNQKQDSRIETVEKIQIDRAAKFREYDAYIISNNLAAQAAIQSVGGIRDRIKGLEDWQAIIDPQHREMYFMKQHGISNRDDFFEQHGYQAPTGPGQEK